MGKTIQVQRGARWAGNVVVRLDDWRADEHASAVLHATVLWREKIYVHVLS